MMDRVEFLYRMKRIRGVEEEIAKRYSEQKMRCPTHLSIGQEAVPVAVGMILNAADYAVSTHRGHAHYLGKGGDLKAMIAEIYGRSTGCSKGRGGSMHLIDRSVGFEGTTAIVGNSIPIGVGLGLSCLLDGDKKLSCVFLGDAATEEGAFYESVNFAAVKKLPVLFVCENNLYSVYSPLNVRQPEGRKIYEMVQSMGVNSVFGDGNSADEAYRILFDAVERIRKSSGPQFVEFSTYRWREHCGPNYDNDLPYRSEEEFLFWQKQDPIQQLSDKLLAERRITQEQIKELEVKIEKEIYEAFVFAETSPFPESSEAYIEEYFLSK